MKKGITQLLSLSFLSSVIGFGALILVVHLLGVEEYGRFAGAFAVFLFLEVLLKVEIKILLLKYDPEISPNIYHTVFSILLLISVAVAIIAVLVILLEILPSNYEVFTEPLLWLTFLLPVSVSTEIPRAVLERKAKFGLIAKQEFFSNITHHVSVLLLIFFFIHDYRSLIVGYYIYTFTIAALSWFYSSFTPLLRLDRQYRRVIYNHGYHLFIQNSMLQAKKLVNPVVVGYLFGAIGVGIVSFAEKVIHGLNFYRNVLHRVSASMLGRVKKENAEIIQMLKKGVLLQVLPLGVILLIGSFIVYGISEFTGNQEWVWLNYLYPYLASGFLFYTLFTIPGIAIQMYFDISSLTWFQILHASAFTVSAIIFLNGFGLIGYGLAELAALPVYYFIYRSLKKQAGDFISDEIIVLVICTGVALHWYYIGWLALLSLLSVFLFPSLLRLYKKEWGLFY